MMCLLMTFEDILAKDDGLQYQLPKHHRCACHLLNLVSTVDTRNANKKGPTKICQGQHSQSLRLSGIRLQGPLLLQRWLKSTANFSWYSQMQQDGTPFIWLWSILWESSKIEERGLWELSVLHSVFRCKSWMIVWVCVLCLFHYL